MEHLGLRIAATPLPADPDRADGFVRRAAAGAGDAGHGDGDAGAGMDQRAGHHLDHGFAAHRAVRFERARVDAEQRLLGFVAVGDDAAVEPVGAAGDIGDGLRDPAAGAAFRGDQRLPRGAQALADGFGQRSQSGIGEGVHGAGGFPAN